MSDWRKSAACAGYDPALWFPGNNQLMRREAIHICHTCPVMMQCRKYAETNIDTPVVETTGFLRTGLACTRALGRVQRLPIFSGLSPIVGRFFFRYWFS